MFVAIQYWRINILLLLFAHDYVCILSFFFYGPLAPEIKDILSYLNTSLTDVQPDGGDTLLNPRIMIKAVNVNRYNAWFANNRILRGK